jgi:predicted oxidoreductase
MNKIPFGPTDLQVSELSLGCMRMGSSSPAEAQAVIAAALECGITFFEHADIYGGGKSEENFAAALSELGVTREDVVLQSKCGIRKGCFDFSKEHILNSMDGILSRLKTDYVDALLLHRPDALFEPEEVAEAFAVLEVSGKVRHFGVSNQNPMQMQLLASAMETPLVANQIQLSIAHTPILDHGFNVNMTNDPATSRDGGILEYCRLHRMTLQPWSPLQYGFFEGVFLGHEKFPELNQVLDRIAKERDLDSSAVAIAWLLRIPGSVQPILGSMTPDRIRKMSRAGDVNLSRDEWYEIYRAAGNKLP